MKTALTTAFVFGASLAFSGAALASTGQSSSYSAPVAAATPSGEKSEKKPKKAKKDKKDDHSSKGSSKAGK